MRWKNDRDLFWPVRSQLSRLDQTRLLLDFNEWANDRILSAAEGLAPDAYEQLGDQFAHILETQRWWHAKWTGGECVYPKPLTIA